MGWYAIKINQSYFTHEYFKLIIQETPEKLEKY